MAGKQLSDGNPTGTTLGQDATDLISFYGGTPTARRANAAMSSTNSIFVHTGLSLVAALSESVRYDMVVSVVQELRTLLVTTLNLHKGGA